MTVLTIPLHMPVQRCENLIRAETAYREVTAVRVCDGFLVIEHERREPDPKERSSIML